MSMAFLHFLLVADSHGRRIVDHQHCDRRHADLGTGHCDDRSGRSGKPVDLDRDIAPVIHEQVVDLRRREAVAARRVDPERDVAAPGVQFVFEHLRGDFIAVPGLVADLAVQVERALAAEFVSAVVLDPVPELSFHVFLPP
jgi:hypothetical protein